MKTNFKSNLKALREDHNLTQQNIADAINVSRSSYAYYESGTHFPSLETVSALAAMFNVSIDQLVNSDFVLRSPKPHYKTIQLQHFDELSEDERSLIIRYRVMSEEKKQKIKKQIDEIIASAEKK